VAKFAYIMLLGLLGAAAAHIGILLLVPHYAGSQLWTGLSADLPAWQFSPLPPQAAAAQRADPFFRQIYCRFNLSESPAHLTAGAGAPFWSLAIYNAEGENIYSLTSATAPDGALDLIAIDPAELAEFKRNPPDIYAETNFAALNDGRNFAVLRALVPSADREAEAAEFLRRARCRKAEYY